MKFKEYLLNENKVQLGQEVGKILTKAQRLKEESQHINMKNTIIFSNELYENIQDLIKSGLVRGGSQEYITLITVAVNLKKSIKNENGIDLKDVIVASVDLLQKLSGNLGVVVNTLASTEKPSDPSDGQVSPSM